MHDGVAWSEPSWASPRQGDGASRRTDFHPTTPRRSPLTVSPRDRSIGRRQPGNGDRTSRAPTCDDPARTDDFTHRSRHVEQPEMVTIMARWRGMIRALLALAAMGVAARAQAADEKGKAQGKARAAAAAASAGPKVSYDKQIRPIFQAH